MEATNCRDCHRSLVKDLLLDLKFNKNYLPDTRADTKHKIQLSV